MREFKVTKTWKVKAWTCLEAIEQAKDGKHVATSVKEIE